MSTAVPQLFGELLRRYRRAAGLSQEALAEQAGLSARGIADLERGVRRFPHPLTVERLANGLGLSAPMRTTLISAGRTRRPAHDNQVEAAFIEVDLALDHLSAALSRQHAA